ncbi:MAG: lysine--tRNA ligase [Haloferacaceae archaeon]
MSGDDPDDGTGDPGPDGDGAGASRRAFWADAVAEDVADEVGTDPDGPVVIKGGVSPSGVPHLGHFNEIMRGHLVAEALRDRGYEVRQVFTSDDRDALREVPRTLATADFELVALDDDRVDAAALGRSLGKPYTDIPDPFAGCDHDSYGDHFTDLLARTAAAVDVPVETVSNTDLYEAGEFEAPARRVLGRRDRAREVLARHQDGVGGDYVPFMPQCAACGRLTTDVRGVDPDAGTVEYACTGLTAGGRDIDGCGHEGVATLREGKLPWRFEWPAQWGVLDVDFEPFGKDHAEGSWPSGTEIAREVLGVEPPVPMTYEWFTLGGEPLSSSSGNVVTVPEVLDLIEPEVLRYFFALDPGKARDLDLSRIDRLVEEFDRFERIYFGEEEAEAGSSEAFADRAYPFVIGGANVQDRGPGRTYDRRLSLTVDVGPFDWEADLRRGPDAYRRRERGSPRIAEGLREELDAFFDRRARNATPREEFRRVQNALFDARDRTIDAYRDRVRLPYTFAAVLGMTDDRDLRVRMARNEGHLPPDPPEWAVADAMGRVERARTWAERMDNEYNYRLQADLPDASFDDRTEAALADLADTVAAGADGETIQGEIYETAKRHDIDVGDFFAAGYRLFFDETQGPRLGEFLGELDREFVVRRLRREG